MSLSKKMNGHSLSLIDHGLQNKNVGSSRLCLNLKTLTLLLLALPPPMILLAAESFMITSFITSLIKSPSCSVNVLMLSV